MNRIYKLPLKRRLAAVSIIRRPNESVVRSVVSVTNIQDDGLRYGQKNGLSNTILKYLGDKPQPGTLILVRCGETPWNKQGRFIGWTDVDLSEHGKKEMIHCARLLLERGYVVDVSYTSLLKRAIRSSWIVKQELNQIYRPAVKSWRLNERMYGALEGLSKAELAAKLGEDKIQKWRADPHERPPPMQEDHIYWHKSERKYANVDPTLLPVSESADDCYNRVMPLWQNEISRDLKEGRNVMVLAHGNSIRGIIKEIDGISTDNVQKVPIPNGIPLVYKFDKNFQPIVQPKAVAPLTGGFLEKQGLLKAALERERELASKIEGYEVVDETANITYYGSSSSSAKLLRSLTRLEQMKQLEKLASEHGDNDVVTAAISTNKNNGATNTLDVNSPNNVSSGSEEESEVGIVTGDKRVQTSTAPHPQDDILQNPLLVIIRHGKTEHNKLGLFTGWEDAPLAEDGRNEALFAGQLMKIHGIQFDVVYTSWLSRAIETAWISLNELDLLWVPIVKSWRLNERMYGALTGLSKKMIKQRHGPAQFLEWRRGFNTPPPPISSFSHHYPGNDDRYVNYVEDLKISWFETIIRSLAHGKLEVHRAFPKSESLKDCMDRAIPYFKNSIVPKSIDQRKNVLISSSENAIRGLLMHLCDIPIDRIHQVEIPTGLPMIYDFKTKRIRLLDDGNTTSPLDRYDFGASLELLLKPTFPTRGVFGRNKDSQPVKAPTDEDEEELPFYDPVIRIKDPNLFKLITAPRKGTH